MSSNKWIVKSRDYELEQVKYQVKGTPIMRDQDPLISEELKLPQRKKIIKKGNITMRRAEFNPLEAPSVGSTNRKVFFSNDPLSSNITSKSHSQNPVTTQTTYSSIPAKESRVSTMPKPIKVIDDFKFISFSLIVNKNFNVNDSIDINWSLIRKNLMDLFCNNFNMEVKSIYSISLDEDDLQKNYKIEQGRNRLEEIEGDKKGNKFNIISSGEHVAKMEVLKREMLQKWEVEDKVGTLKIIIHCTKMLNDVFTPKFYTHKFLIISDILDIFSKLVYERIYKLSFTSDKSTEFNDINPGMINNTAKDICYNWILKCSCIRELLPRIYIDITFLRIFKFIYTEKEIEQKILTIAKMIRGLSHPLISFYVSMYLAKISLNLYPKFKSFILIILDNISKFILNEEMIKKLGYDNITLEEMKKVLEPCVEWIIYCLSKNMTTNQYNNLMKIYDETKNFFLIKNLIIHAPVKFVFNTDYLEYIFACIDLYDYNEAINLYMIICHKIINSNNPIEGKYISLMWEKIKKSKSKSIFIDCCVLLGEIVIKFHSEDLQEKFFEEVFDIFKSTISASMTEDNTYYHKFEIFLYSILTKINNYSNILNVDNFLYLLENFNDTIKLNICHTILTQIIDSNEKISDPYLAFSLMKIGKYLHDSVEISNCDKAITIARKKEISEILINFIRKVDFGIDYENHLNFLTEARGSYTDIDEVIEILINEVQRICVLTNKIVKGKHNKKTLRFCKVCIAYCQITIPSLKNLYSQLKQLLWTSQIALTNNLISECDSLVKNILTILSQLINEDILNRVNSNQKIEKSEIENLNNFIKNLISFLIVVPSNPESPFQLISGIMNIFIIENSENQEKENKSLQNQRSNYYVTKMKIKLNSFICLIKYISTQLQFNLPYHLPNVDSNDEIFPSDENFTIEGNSLIEAIMQEILSDTSELDSKLPQYENEEYEFLTIFCLSCAEIFASSFEETKFLRSVINKMVELARSYIEHMKKSSNYKANTDNYISYITRLSIG